MSQPTRRLVNLLHYRPVGIKGWEYDPYHDETLTRLFKAQPLPPLEPDDPTVLTATSPKPETSSNGPQKPTGSRPDTSVPQESKSHPDPDPDPDPVQINRIDWLPRGWPPTIPAPVDLTSDSIIAFCDYLDTLISCFTYEISQGNGPTMDLSFTDESLAINYLGKALEIPSPFGLNVQSGYQRDAAAIQQAVENLRAQINNTVLATTSQDLDPIPPNLSARSKKLFLEMLKAKKTVLFQDLETAVWGDPQEDETITKALKRLRNDLKRNLWNFEIKRSERKVIWIRKKGQNVP
jgi:hypothetical protein